MKKYLFLILLVFSSCDSDDENAPLVDVDLVGTWSYTFSTKGSFCDGFYPDGFYIVSASEINNEVLGQTELVGDTFGQTSQGECALVPANEIYEDSRGQPRIQNRIEYVENQDFSDGIIYRLLEFSENRIVEEATYESGVVVTATFVR